MTDTMTITREDRDAILAAVAAIGREMKNLTGQNKNAMLYYTVGQNLALIQSILVGAQRFTPN